MEKRLVFCPKCRSLNVTREIDASLALGVPQKWLCNDCGFSNFVFPEMQKESEDELGKIKIEKLKEVKKEWGKELWLANTDLYCGKKLILEKGKRVSLHKHKNKDETFYIDKGRVLMEIGKDIGVLKQGDAVRIKPGTLHRYTGLMESVIIEISTHHEDKDTYREENQLSGDAPKEIMKRYK